MTKIKSNAQETALLSSPVHSTLNYCVVYKCGFLFCIRGFCTKPRSSPHFNTTVTCGSVIRLLLCSVLAGFNERPFGFINDTSLTSKLQLLVHRKGVVSSSFSIAIVSVFVLKNFFSELPLDLLVFCRSVFSINSPPLVVEPRYPNLPLFPGLHIPEYSSSLRISNHLLSLILKWSQKA